MGPGERLASYFYPSSLVMFYDVIVIGAGLAGLMAAEAAQSQGARVLILARGMGSLPLMTGCIDGLGYFPSTSLTPLPSPLRALTQMRENNPRHPYVIVGQERISSAMAHFQELGRSGKMPYAGDLNSKFLIPTPLGTFRPTCLVPETMKSGNLSLSGCVLLLGFAGLKDFSPFLAAENLNVLHSQGKIAPSFRAESLLPLDLAGKAINGLNLARAFDKKEFREKFVGQANSLLKPGERLGLPAVLGFHDSWAAWSDLQEKLGVEIFEIPMPPPSVPGLRLFDMLKAHLQQRGVRMIVGLSALRPLAEPKMLQGFSLGEAKNSPTYRAKAFVLATGKFVGGGLDSEQGRIYETLLDLPLLHSRSRKEWFNLRLLTTEGQPFNVFGVEVDENLQPTDPGGQVIFSNLFAAGGIIAHADSISEKSGGGIAISTGFLAGKLAAALGKASKVNHEA
jgi:glycerol-3-phosphate dehydrogenase subunit B